MEPSLKPWTISAQVCLPNWVDTHVYFDIPHVEGMGGGGTFSLPFIKCEQSSSRTQFPILKIWKFLPKSDCRAYC